MDAMLRCISARTSSERPASGLLEGAVVELEGVVAVWGPSGVDDSCRRASSRRARRAARGPRVTRWRCCNSRTRASLEMAVEGERVAADRRLAPRRAAVFGGARRPMAIDIDSCK